MTFSFGDSFDLYAAPADMTTGYWDSGSAGSVGFVAGRFSGSQCMRVTGSTFNLTKSSGVNDAVHHIAVAFFTATAIAGSTLGTYFQLLDGVTAQCSIVFRSDGAILLTSGAANGTVLDTYTGAFPVVNTWYQFEFEVTINNTTGRFRVRKNGNNVDDYDSTAIRDTQNSANAYANKLTIANQAGNSQSFDDLFWRSDASSVAWMGDIRCYTRMPASDASVQFSRSTGATNFGCVDEAQQNSATDYVFDSTPGDADFYGIAAIASTPVTTFAVTTRGYMLKSDAGTRTAAVQLRSGASTVTSGTTVLTTSGWQWVWRQDLTDPATGAAWTAAGVNTAQIGPVVIA